MSSMSGTSSSPSLHNTVPTYGSHQKLSENNQNTDHELDAFPKSWDERYLVSTNNHTTNRELRAKGIEEQVFDVHAGPPTQADYNETIPKIGTNARDAYAEARATILKELTRPSKYHDLDMLERAFQDLRAATRDGTDTIQLTNSNVASINRPSIGYNAGKSRERISNTQGKGSPTNAGPPKKPTHGYDWRLELYRTHPPKKATPKLIRAILRYHDFESQGDDDTLEDTLELAKIFGLQDIEWDSDSEHAEEVFTGTFRALMRYLTTLGYRSFSACSENHRGRLEIRPAKDQDPPRLPKWLRIDFLKPCKGVDNHIHLERNLNNCIQTGAGLWNNGDASVEINCSVDAVGTLGPIMKSRK